MTNNPISDLSYRHYDGPLNSPVARWWSISKMTMNVATKKRGFWGWSIFSAWWYLILLAVFWFVQNILGNNTPQASKVFFEAIIWKDQFIHAFSMGQTLVLVVALLVGAGSIANDNRSNALLIYLSKPCTRLDYVVGKWVGVFILITLVNLLPMGVFYLFGAMSYQEYGFVSKDPFMFFKLIPICMVSGAMHASLSLGISSLFNQGRIAGATYAGLYFLTNIFTHIIAGINVVTLTGGRKAPPFITQAFYMSVDGIQIAVAKVILQTNGSELFPGLGGGGGRPRPGRGQSVSAADLVIGMPSAPLYIGLFLLLTIGGFLIAWSRVKAVEVVG